jgi:hypothetical protein
MAPPIQGDRREAVILDMAAGAGGCDEQGLAESASRPHILVDSRPNEPIDQLQQRVAVCPRRLEIH